VTSRGVSPRVVVTGAAGFLGRSIVAELAAHGLPVFGLGRRSSSLPPCDQLVEWHDLDLPAAGLAPLLERVRPDVLIHAAGPASVAASTADPGADFRGSVTVSWELLDCVRRAAPDCRVVLLSSAAVYGDAARLPLSEMTPPAPISPYGFHKLLSEYLAAEFSSVYGLRTSVARIFSAYGPGLRRQVLWDICRKALEHPVVELLGTGDETRDFIHALDVARGIHTIIAGGRFEGEVYNLATGQETTIRDLAERLVAALGRPRKIRFTGVRREGDPERWRADISRLRSLGFTPQVTLEAGLADYARWVVERQ
jgi:UDP-glucose 4-epimerase